MQLRQKVIAHLVDETQLDKCIYLQKLCNTIDVSLPLHEIALHKFATAKQERERYLRYLVKDLEFPLLQQHFDPYRMYLGQNWQQSLSLQENENSRQLAICREIQNDLEQRGIPLSLAHIALLQSGLSANSSSIDVDNSSPGMEISLDVFCQRMWRSKFFPFRIKVARLALRMLAQRDVERALQDQLQLQEKWSLQIPLAHILVVRHKIDPWLLHALLLAQLTFEEDTVCIVLGKNLVGKFTARTETVPLLQQIQQLAAEFIEWSFSMQWLDFTSRQELRLVEQLEKVVSQTNITRAKEAQKQMEQAGLLLPLSKIIALQQSISQDELAALVMSIVYKASAEKINKTIRIAKRGNSRASMDGIQQQEAIKKRNTTSKVAARLMERLQQASSPQDSEEQTQAEASPPRKKAKTTKTKMSLPDHNRENLALTPEIDIARVRLAKKLQYIDEEQVIDCAIAQFDARQRGEEKYVFDLLRQRHFLRDEHLSEVIAARPISEIPVFSPRSFDLKLANLLIEYKMVERDRIQRCLGIQSHLHRFGIRQSLDGLLVQTKTLASEIVAPIVKRCKEQSKTAEIPEIASRDKTFTKTNVPERRSPKVQLSLAAVSVLFLAISAWQFFSGGNHREPFKPVTRLQTQKVPEETIEKKPPKLHHKGEKNEIRPQKVYRPEHQRWEKHQVSQEEKEFLSQNWLQQSDLAIELKEFQVDSVKDDESYKLRAKGKLQIPPLPPKRQLIVTLQVFDRSKQRSFDKLEKRFYWNPEDDISIELGPFYKPLPVNRYYLRVSLQSDLQSPLVRRLLQLENNRDWWIPFVENAENGKQFYTREAKTMAIFFDKLRQHVQRLEKLAEVFSNRQAQNKKHTRFLASWESAQNLLEKELKQYSSRYFVPVFPETERSLREVLSRAVVQYEEIKKWHRGEILLAPQFSQTLIVVFEWLERATSDFEQERKVLLQAATMEGANR